MRPEERAEKILIEWLKEKAEFIEEIYLNRKNGLGLKCFSVRGDLRKPDILIKINQGFGDKYIAIEVKPANKSKDILRAKKIVDYYFNYVTNKAAYFVENEEIIIEHFLVATDKSKDGYLFEDESILDNLGDSKKKGKHEAVRFGLIPRFEGNKTYGFIRSLQQWFGEFRDKHEKKCGLGVLICDISDNFAPRMQVSHYNLNKRKWSQRWWKL